MARVRCLQHCWRGASRGEGVGVRRMPRRCASAVPERRKGHAGRTRRVSQLSIERNPVRQRDTTMVTQATTKEQEHVVFAWKRLLDDDKKRPPPWLRCFADDLTRDTFFGLTLPERGLLDSIARYCWSNALAPA